MKRKVLVCDDEEGIRESLKLILNDLFPLIITEDGWQCLECLENDNTIGVVLLDIKMPQLNGLDTLKQIKQKHPGVKVILVTGYKSVETASEATRLGADGYIVKPFNTKEIQETVGRSLK